MPIDLPQTPVVQKILTATNSKLKEINDMGSVYEIVTERNDIKKVSVFYLTKDRKYIIGGALFDSNLLNITKQRLDGLNKVDFSQIPIQDAIAIKKGSGDRKLVMITDVDCPFCRRAHEWLKTQDNYTLYVFLSPIDQLHPAARDKSIQILCADSKAEALDSVKSDKPLTAAKCKQGEEMLAKHTLVSQILGVNGTPLFITEDGRKIEGFVQPVLSDYLTKKEKNNE